MSIREVGLVNLQAVIEPPSVDLDLRSRPAGGRSNVRAFAPDWILNPRSVLTGPGRAGFARQNRLSRSSSSFVRKWSVNLGPFAFERLRTTPQHA